MRAAIMQAIETSGKNMKRDGGVNVLALHEREACTNLLSQLNDYGVFVVPGGELESWLKALNTTGHGPAWLIQMFDAMGSDPTDAGYVKPDGGDVWEFMKLVKTWLNDPRRKGIPG